jgi:hypothetical protein
MAALRGLELCDHSSPSQECLALGVTAIGNVEPAVICADRATAFTRASGKPRGDAGSGDGWHFLQMRREAPIDQTFPKACQNGPGLCPGTISVIAHSIHATLMIFFLDPLSDSTHTFSILPLRPGPRYSMVPVGVTVRFTCRLRAFSTSPFDAFRSRMRCRAWSV